MFSLFRKKKIRREVLPDHFLYDDVNISNLEHDRMEGSIERPIHGAVTIALGVCVAVFALLFLRTVWLQTVDKKQYQQIAESNRFDRTIVFAPRGVIFDRNQKPLAWNTITKLSRKDHDGVISTIEVPTRTYGASPGFAHVLGYVRLPEVDDKGFFWRTETIGETGIEKIYDDALSGANGYTVIETDVGGTSQNSHVAQPAVAGENITLSIDADLQTHLAQEIGRVVDSSGYGGGAGAIINVHTGEMLALTSYPEFDPLLLTQGGNSDKLHTMLTSSRNYFLDRAVSGLYVPGSVMKPFIALGALDKGVVTPQTTVYSTGKLEIPNPYNPALSSIFKDWRPEGHGVTNVYHAIADSVNTYFYEVTGGYKNQKGIGIAGIEEYSELFGIAQKTGISLGEEKQGVIPSPEWKAKTFKDGTWRLGDTYISGIGQFGFQVTPLQMLRGIAAIANNGTLLKPILVPQFEKQELTPVDKNISAENYQVIRDAMRQTVTEGTAKNLNFPFIHVAAKTGTAQVGKNNAQLNSWVVGFFPYENPQYAFVVLLEHGPKTGAFPATEVMRAWFSYIFNSNPNWFVSLNS